MEHAFDAGPASCGLALRFGSIDATTVQKLVSFKDWLDLAPIEEFERTFECLYHTDIYIGVSLRIV
jgi:hypothetical protein